MTYEEFFQIVSDTYSIVETCADWNKKAKRGVQPTMEYRHWVAGDEEAYKVEWSMGGSSGGNCWDDSPSRPYPGDPEPDLDLCDLFEKVCPSMSFLQHRKVMNAVLERDEKHNNEYYGNYSVYGIKKVRYSALYDKLVEFGIITG